MNWYNSPYVALLFIVSLITGGLAVLAYNRRHVTGARSFLLLGGSLCLWCIFYAMELASNGLSLKTFWAQMQYPAIVLAPVAWLGFALEYTGRSHVLTRKNITLLSIIPAITVILTATNTYHHLIFKHLAVDTQGGFPVLIRSFGLFFWIHTTYSYGLIFVGSFLLVNALILTPHLYRGQALALLTGVLAPIAFNAVYLLGFSPLVNIDPTPFGFGVSAVAVAWAVFRKRLLDITPIAYDTVIRSIKDGILLLDDRNYVVYLNPAAEEILGRKANKVIGQSAQDILSAWPDLIEKYRFTSETHEEVSIEIGDAKRVFDLRISPIISNNRFKGRVVMLRDFSERKRLMRELQAAIDQVKTLKGLLPLCANCKNIRDDDGYWHSVEQYVTDNTDAQITHSLCPDCVKKLYPELKLKSQEKT